MNNLSRMFSTRKLVCGYREASRESLLTAAGVHNGCFTRVSFACECLEPFLIFGGNLFSTVSTCFLLFLNVREVIYIYYHSTSGASFEVMKDPEEAGFRGRFTRDV